MASQICSHKATSFFLTFVVIYSVAITGEAYASPASDPERNKMDERIEYAISLNSIASTLMNWYGSLITRNNSQTVEERTNIVDISHSYPSWEDHIATYPENITGIQITSADMNKQDSKGQYQFDVEVLMTYVQSETSKNKRIHEMFLFQTSNSDKPVIKQITSLTPDNEQNTSDANQTTTFKHEYYKSREFAYAWLAYLDGVNAMGSQINIEQWLDKANYSVKIGSFELDEQLVSSLQKRNQHMGKGGHLLRSVTEKLVEGKPDHFELDIIIDWKGTDPSGLPAIAKINQIIQYKLQEDGTWIVLSIKEKHLLPDLEPWHKLLC